MVGLSRVGGGRQVQVQVLKEGARGTELELLQWLRVRIHSGQAALLQGDAQLSACSSPSCTAT